VFSSPLHGGDENTVGDFVIALDINGSSLPTSCGRSACRGRPLEEKHTNGRRH